ncbi:protein Hol1p [[Candida] anglica]|uniref:Protein Hol1p n=1 Tax=[Candida] anglica TaxID=148631 RepID=A0ABP0E6M5_9ASCO
MAGTYDDEDYIPGTVNIFASKYEDDAGPGGQPLKKNKNGVILLPQPSDSPNDPLNWSLTRKMWHFALVSFITGLTAATSNDAAAAQEYLNDLYGITYDAMNTGAGILFIFIGWSCIFFAPASSLYGRRITYLICLLCGCLGSVWFAKSNRTSDTLWSQMFVGMSESCAEAQVQQSLSDIFFQHQLGGALTIYILATSVGSFLGPLVANFIAQGMGFRWIGWWGAIICGATMIVVFFTCEETVFDRTKYIPVIDSSFHQTSSNENSQDLEDSSEKNEKLHQHTSPRLLTVETTHRAHPEEEEDTTIDATTGGANANNLETGVVSAQDEKMHPYWKRIAIITPSSYLEGFGFKQYIFRFVVYFKVFTIPAVWFSGLLWGLQDAYMTFFLTTQDDYFSSDPWNYSANGVAIMNVATLIGAVVGCLMSGVFSDVHVLWLAKRNNSVFEPEMRLWLLFITLIISPMGLIMFGVGAARQWPWQVIYVGLGFIGFGWGSIGDTAMSYLMDSYPEIVIQGMVGVSIINNTLACIFTFVCSKWLEASGTQNTYIALAVIDFVSIATIVPMFIWGKTFRKKTKRLYIKLVELSQGM